MDFNRTCNNHKLSYDQACLSVSSDTKISFWRQYAECDKCDLQQVLKVSNGTDSLILSTLWPVLYEISNEKGDICCNGTYNFKEYGKYILNVTNCDCTKIITVDQPDEPLLPILVAVIVLLSIATLWYVTKGLVRRIVNSEIWTHILRRGESGAELLGTNPSPSRRVNTRLMSADVFRGIIISLMILVNQGGGGYWILRHAPWNGLTIADLVFPSFAWLMGLAMCLSLHTRLRTSMTRSTAFTQVVRRSIILILIGVVLGSEARYLDNLRLPGVLQRLGLTYLIVASVECFTMDASNNYTPGTAIFRDLRSAWKQWLFTLSLVTLHLIITFVFHDPLCPAGYMGPGGLQNGSFAVNCTGGVAGYIDRVVFGPSHLYQFGSYKHLYQTIVPYDPEGLLGTLNCALIVQMGAQAARILLAYSHAKARVSRWLLWSVGTGLLAGTLCFFSKNNGPIPVNKNLWSLSFCLATSSLAFLVQALLYIVIDMRSMWGGRPFYYAGRNALLIYIGSELFKARFPFEWKLVQPSHMELLAMNVFSVTLWLIIAVFLHRKNVILTI